MTCPPLEVADIVRQYGDAYLARYGAVTSTTQRRVLHAIGQCRTAVGQETATFFPEVLFLFSPEAQLPKVGVGDGAAELVITLTTIQGALDMLAEGW